MNQYLEIENQNIIIIIKREFKLEFKYTKSLVLNQTFDV
jgi:hypothetical protein